MQQKTLRSFVDSESLWGTDICPKCKRTFASPQGAKTHYGLSHGERYNKARLEATYGVPARWLLTTLHNTLEMSVLSMSKSLPIGRYGINRLMDELSVARRGRSEAEELKWEHMTETQRKNQLAEAHDKTRQLFAAGEGAFQIWQRENPELDKEMRVQAGRKLHKIRKRNGMRGATGPESPTWRGGHGHKDRITKLLPGESFWRTRQEALERDDYTCQMCGDVVADIGRDPDAHHIIPILCGGVNSTELLISLCPSCHTTAEHYSYSFCDPLLS